MFKRQNSLSTYIIASIIISIILFASLQSSAKSIDVMDSGLNMVRETIELPADWKMNVDIASNPQTGLFIRFKYDVIGPDGEVLRELPPINYGIVTGRSLQQTWQLIINESVAEIMVIKSIGNLINGGPIAKRSLRSLGLKTEQIEAVNDKLFEVTITGNKNGQPYSAVLVFSIQSFDGQNGILYGGIVASPSKRLDSAIETSLVIGKSKKMNKQYDSVRGGLISQHTRTSAASHNQRMQNNQQRFNQHQKMMSDRSNMYDQQNQQWLNNFRSSTPNSSSTGYNSNDAYIDSIHETSTFSDPSTGQNKTVDGQYQYNYTDGMGNYYGTDNPGFNPGVMPNGDWQETQPLQPQY